VEPRVEGAAASSKARNPTPDSASVRCSTVRRPQQCSRGWIEAVLVNAWPGWRSVGRLHAKRRIVVEQITAVEGIAHSWAKQLARKPRFKRLVSRLLLTVWRRTGLSRGVQAAALAETAPKPSSERMKSRFQEALAAEKACFQRENGRTLVRDASGRVPHPYSRFFRGGRPRHSGATRSGGTGRST